MTTSTLVLPVAGGHVGQGLAGWAAVAFVASYSSPATRQAYTTQLRLWFDWCEQHQRNHWRMSAARTSAWSCTHAISKPEVSLRPRSR